MLRCSAEKRVIALKIKNQNPNIKITIQNPNIFILYLPRSQTFDFKFCIVILKFDFWILDFVCPWTL